MTQGLIYSLTMRVYETKFLGVIIDDRISWKAQIQAVKAKLSKTVSIMYRARCFLNETGMKILYFSLFMPCIDYCSEIWGNTYRSNTLCISLLQKRVIRMIVGANVRSHTNVLFIRLNLLKFYDYIEYKTVAFMYRVKFALVPTNIISLFYVGEDNRYETRQRGNFVQLYIRTTMRAMCLSVVGVRPWNNLSVSQTNCRSVYNFKKMLKSIISDRYVINEVNRVRCYVVGLHR